MFRKIKELINKWKYSKVLKKHTESETLFIDLGSTSIKCAYKGELISFKSSIRKVTDVNEITPATKNYIKVNDEYFIIGESEKSNEVCEYKVDRNYIDIMILYSLKVFREKGIQVSNNIKLNILLPFNEIQFKNKLEKRLNGLYKVDDEQVTLTVSKVFCEGECSSVFYKEHYRSKGNVVVINIGGKTTDTLLINSDGNREKIVSIDLGTQYLLSQITRYTKAPTSNVLNTWLVDGYKFTKEEQEHLGQAGKEFISNIWNDLYAGVIKIANYQNTEIICVGGGSNILKECIQEAIPKGYKVKTLSSYENIYSDILGAMLLSKESVTINNTPKEEIKEFIEEVALDLDVPEVIVAATTEKKTKYQIFCELFESGLSSDEIMARTNMAKQTFKNYKCKYTKELKLVEV